MTLEGLSEIDTIAVLFTDLVDSTQRSVAMNPVVADSFRRRHFSILRHVIAQTGGSEVKNLGDGLMVAFTAPSAALRCAVAMQQAVDRENVLTDSDTGLRVGLSAGEVTREGDDFFGDPIVEAARLCARAAAGQILAASLIISLAGRRSAVTLSPLGPLALKGFPSPIDAVEVLWDKSTQGRLIPLPARLAHSPHGGFIARSPELDVLQTELKEVSAGGDPRLVFVSGEPGIGKTTLVAELARNAQAIGACVLFGRCDEQMPLPYQPFVEALGHYVANCEAAVLREHVDEYGSEISALLPQVASRIDHLPPNRSADPDTSRWLLFASVARLLGATSKTQPVVVALDDLQWADSATLQLLRYLATSPELNRVLLVGTYREADIVSGHPLAELIAVLHRSGAYRRISLKGFAEDDIASLLRVRAGHELDETGLALARALCEETDGNPFFIGEILRHLSETGSIYQDVHGRWQGAEDLARAGLPQSVREVISARINRLGVDCQHLLEVAAVIGRDFNLDLLSLAGGLDIETALDLVERACTSDLVYEVPGSVDLFRFRHALIQHTLYSLLSRTRRTRLHRRIAEVLESLPDSESHLADLARHWMGALQPVDLERAFLYARRAGDSALQALAPGEACRFYSQALGVLEDIPDRSPEIRTDLLIRLGTAQRQSGEGAFRETLRRAAQAALDVGDPGRLVEAVLAADRGFPTMGRIDPDRVATLEAALEALDEGDSPERARLLAILANELTWGSPLERRLALVDSAVAMARRVGDPATIIHVANLCCFTTQIPHTLARRLDYTAEALELARGLDDPVLLHWAAASRSIAAVHACLGEEIDADFDVLEKSAAELTEPALLWHAKFRLASRALIAGDPVEAEVLAVQARDIGIGAGQPDAPLYLSPQIAVARLQQGRMNEIIPQVASTAAHVSAMPVFLALLALSHSDCDQTFEAQQLLTDALSRGLSTLPLDNVWLSAVTCWAQVAADCQSREAAGQLYSMLEPFEDQACYDRLTFVGFVAHYLGELATVLENYQAAERHYVAAAARARQMDAAWAAAATALARGQMYLARSAAGDAAQAEHFLTEAIATATARGYATIERRSRSALNRIRS
jgi:class 3 adenylate cyclase